MKEFRNDYILINDHGIDLLRNHFPYRHIDFSEIHLTRIYSGYLLQNRLIPLLAGLFLIGLFWKLANPEMQLLKEIPDSLEIKDYRGMVWIMLLPLISLILGCYFSIQSLRKSKILLISLNAGQFNIRIKEFEKKKLCRI